MKNIRQISGLELWMLLISRWYKNLKQTRRSIVVPRPMRSRSLGIRRITQSTSDYKVAPDKLNCTQLDDIIALQTLVRCLSTLINSAQKKESLQ